MASREHGEGKGRMRCQAAVQGDTNSQKLLKSTLESVFEKFDWSKMVININGKYLSYL